jgi:hypothetical protein
LRDLRDVQRVNLQFVRDSTPISVDGIETLVVLRRDSREVTGCDGTRKPLVGEMCAVLAREAARRGADYFCLTNADILFSQDAIALMLTDGREGYAFSRMEVDPTTGADRSIHAGGVDAIAAQPRWWLANRRRFRDFIIGESTWDQIYTSVLLRHADAVLLNVHPLIRHIEHPVMWSHQGGFADYNGYLGAVDSHYFTLWCEYHAERERWLRRGGSEDEHFDMQRRVFTRPWPVATKIMQPLKKARAWLRHELA